MVIKRAFAFPSVQLADATPSALPHFFLRLFLVTDHARHNFPPSHKRTEEVYGSTRLNRHPTVPRLCRSTRIYRTHEEEGKGEQGPERVAYSRSRERSRRAPWSQRAAVEERVPYRDAFLFRRTSFISLRRSFHSPDATGGTNKIGISIGKKRIEIIKKKKEKKKNKAN